jgi:hypothetical protein
MTEVTSRRKRGEYADLAPIPEGAERTSVWEDFIDILYTPAAVFIRRQRAGFWIPLLVVTLAVGGLMFANAGILEPILSAEYDRGLDAVMRKNPQMTPEMAEQGKSLMQTFARVGALVFTPIAIFLIGFTLWAVGKLFDAKESLRVAMMVSAYSFVPRIIEAILVSVQGAMLNTSAMDSRFRLTFGVGRFLNPNTTPPLMLQLLGRVDLITIWITILLAIGLSVTGRISRVKAAIAAALVWLLGALPEIFQALTGPS